MTGRRRGHRAATIGRAKSYRLPLMPVRGVDVPDYRLVFRFLCRNVIQVKYLMFFGLPPHLSSGKTNEKNPRKVSDNIDHSSNVT